MTPSKYFLSSIERRVLYVDSNVDQLELLEKHIEFYNSESMEKIILEVTSDPTKAIGIIESGNFDIIICDYSMPQLSGLELLEHIKEKGLDIPFILLTGKGSEEIANQAISKGAIYYFDKVNLIKGYDELIRVINNAVTVQSDPKSIINNEIKYKTLFENIDYAVMLIYNNIIIECNNRALELFKSTRIDILGKELLDFSPRERNDNGNFNKEIIPKFTVDLIFNEVLSGNSKQIKWQFSLKDDSSFYAEITFKKIDIIGQEIIQVIFYDITQSLEIERKLLESELRTQLIIDNSPAVVYIKDLQGRYLLVNKQFELRYNLKTEEIIGKTDFDLFFEETAKQFKLSDNFVLNNKQSVQLEELIPQDNKVHTYLAIKFPLIDITGNIIGLGCFSTDISHRKEIEEAIKSSEKKYRELIENLGEGIMIVNKNEEITFSNKAADKLFGIKEGSLYGRNMLEFLSPKEFKQIREETQIRMSGSGSIYELEIIRDEDKEHRFIKVNTSPMYNNDNEFEGSFGIVFDITEQKREQMKRIEYESVLNMSSCYIFILRNDENFTIEDVSENITKLGYDNSDLKKKEVSFTELMAKRGEKSDKKFLEQVIDGKSSEFKILKNNGEKLRVKAKFKAKANNQGGITHYHGIIEEITEKRNLEKKYNELKTKFELLSESIDNGVIIHDENFNISFINKKLCSMLNYTQTELINSSISNIIKDEYHKSVLEQSKDISFIKTINYVVTFVKKDGKLLERAVLAKKEKNQEEQISYLLIVN